MRFKFLKKTNDFIIGLLLLGLGIYVLLTKDIIQGNLPAAAIVSPLVRPDVYVRLIGGCLAFCAVILIVKSINFSGRSDTRGFHFVLTREIVLTVLSLIIYTILLTRIGFALSTFSLSFFLVCMYQRREKSGVGKRSKKGIIKDTIIAIVYSAALVMFVYFVFTRVLYVNLP